MATRTLKQRIWGWYFFDWASQPYNTLLLTFVFGPYVRELIGDGATAQSTWGFTVGAAGLAIALMAPVLGALADAAGNRMSWIWGFSLLYVVGAGAVWFAAPGTEQLWLILLLFAIGLVGMEFATIFTNAMLPDLGPRSELGRISGNGWAFGYLGGLVALVIMLAFFAENAATGLTLLGTPPAFGLDPALREGTRLVGPLTAVWFIVFMIPFFWLVRDPKTGAAPRGAVRKAMTSLKETLSGLPQTPSLFAYLASSMFYRDALVGMYTFGGIYASGVLGWTIVDIGKFGILAIVAGALAAWLGGKADARHGPKPVITLCIILLTLVGVAIVTVSPTSVLWVPVAPGSQAPDIAFYVIGAVIGGAGGVLQSASRTIMVRQANPARMTEAFGLYALAGKATSFLAPTLIGLVTLLTGSQQFGVTPLIGLFLVGLLLLRWVKPDGDFSR